MALILERRTAILLIGTPTGMKKSLGARRHLSNSWPQQILPFALTTPSANPTPQVSQRELARWERCATILGPDRRTSLLSVGRSGSSFPARTARNAMPI